MRLQLDTILTQGIEYDYLGLEVKYLLNTRDINAVKAIITYYNELNLEEDTTKYTFANIFELYCDTQYYDNDIEEPVEIKKMRKRFNIE